MTIKNKKRILTIHKILGLATGIVLFIVGVTGCVYAFRSEIENIYDTYKYVEIQQKKKLTASTIKVIAEKEIPNKEIHGVVFGENDKAVEVVFFQREPTLFYQSLFINPYNGKVLKQIDRTRGFFAFVINGHTRLWLPKKIGSLIVSYATLLFFVLIISGLLLWMPKNKKGWKQRVNFDWKETTRWKRKNFDIHTVVGFYISTLGLMFAFTGCVMAFNWFYFIAYKGVGGTKNPQFVTPNNLTKLKLKKDDKLYDKLIPNLKNKYKKADSFELHFPENDSISILVEVNNSKGLYYDRDYLFFDQNNLKEIETTSLYGKYKHAKFADKLIRMNYDIHIGAIGGITGKIIAFLASLVCASLPVTGILLWYGRKYKKR